MNSIHVIALLILMQQMMLLNATQSSTSLNSECINHGQCQESKACVDGTCSDPCLGMCGGNTTCRVTHHCPLCVCMDGFTGDPYLGCRKVKKVYHYHTDKELNFYGALEDCFSRGMRLATVQDDEEYNLLLNSTIRSDSYSYTFWLSGSDLSQNGSYVWMSTGRPMNYTHWGEGEPMKLKRKCEVEHCVAIRRSLLLYSPMFIDLCSNTFHYVCELYQ